LGHPKEQETKRRDQWIVEKTKRIGAMKAMKKGKMMRMRKVKMMARARKRRKKAMKKISHRKE